VVVSLVRYLWEEVRWFCMVLLQQLFGMLPLIGALDLYQGFFIIGLLCELVHGWIILSEGIYLRKVGWVFPWVWGFPRITLCIFFCLFMMLIFQYMVYDC
jgi:hypothetical protein